MKEVKRKENNIYALLGFIFSLTIILAIPGLVLAIFGLKYAKDYKNDRKGFAIAGLTISIVVILFYILIKIGYFENNKTVEDKEDTVCVTFMLDESQYDKKCGEKGFVVDKPVDPTKEGYEFKYWSTKKDSNKESDKYSFDSYVNLDKTLYSIFTEKKQVPSSTDQITNNENNNQPVETPKETPSTNNTPQVSRYESIYNEYSNRLRSECPNLSITECATIANEGVEKMASYMWSAKGTEGQYATYESWASKLYDVYLESAR